VDPGFSLSGFPRKFPVLALHPCLLSSSYSPFTIDTVMHHSVTNERYNSRHVLLDGVLIANTQARALKFWQTTRRDVPNTNANIYKQTNSSIWSGIPTTLFIPRSSLPQKSAMLRESSGVFRLTLAMAFLYLIVACWIRLCILIFPSPQGTTTRVLPKHTVTFIFARYSQRLHREARKVLNSSGRISKRRQHYIHTGKKAG